jgi:beta-glucosidase
MEHFGLNYYFRQVITDDPAGPAPRAQMISVPDWNFTAMGWEVHADGLEQLLVRVGEDYGAKRIYVTENGSAWPDQIEPDGNVEDKDRIAYLEEHLDAVVRAADKGAPVVGYFAWSLLDNFEWAYGYAKRFGLVHVDYTTQARTIKASGYRYADIIRAHRAKHSSLTV